MNHDHSQRDKIVRLNGLGSPKVTQEGHPKGFAILYKCRRTRENKGIFPWKNLWTTCCKRNYFILIINYKFYLLEKVLCGMFECDKMNNVEGELFCFQLCFINCESVLSFWTYVLIWMFSGLFCDNFTYE